MMTLRPALALVACVLAAVPPARAQCMLANPSFELSGSPFAGWSTFGTVAAVANAPHGARAARVTGPNSGTWNVSGLWQSLACTPGQRWDVSVLVAHPSSAPLTGGSAAIVNIEWRDAAGALLSYESHTAADASTPADTWRQVAFQSGAAPASTASIHFVLGVLQGPSDPTPQALFDVVSCVNAGPPTLETLQWNDFPTGRTVSFSGRSWRVKGTGYYGPGPNLFDGTSSGVWVDAVGRLHLAIHRIGGSWYSSEAALVDPLGYGDYVFTTRGPLDTLDPNAVLGLFLWQYGPCYDTAYLWWNPYDEIDVEFSRWGNPGAADAQFVVQPGGTGNVHRFNATFADSEVTSHAMRWLPDRVEYRSWRGGPDAESPATRIASWTYTGALLPRPESPRVHVNLWQLAAPATAQEVVLDAFTFRSACSSGDCGVLAVGPEPGPGTTLRAAAPNPFADGTTLRYRVAAAGPVELAVFDLAGRRVRTLERATHGAGEYAARWDGTDASGRRVPPGVYLCRLLAPGAADAKRVVVLH